MSAKKINLQPLDGSPVDLQRQLPTFDEASQMPQFTREELLAQYGDIKKVPAGTVEKSAYSDSVLTFHVGGGWTGEIVKPTGQPSTLNHLPLKDLVPSVLPSAPNDSYNKFICSTAMIIDDLAHFLRHTRSQKNYTQSEAAKLSGLTRQTVAKAEDAFRLGNVSLVEFARALDAYNLDIRATRAHRADDDVLVHRDGLIQWCSLIERRRQGMKSTIEEMANRAGISKRHWIRIEQLELDNIALSTFLNVCHAVRLEPIIETPRLCDYEGSVKLQVRNTHPRERDSLFGENCPDADKRALLKQINEQQAMERNGSQPTEDPHAPNAIDVFSRQETIWAQMAPEEQDEDLADLPAFARAKLGYDPLSNKPS